MCRKYFVLYILYHNCLQSYKLLPNIIHFHNTDTLIAHNIDTPVISELKNEIKC